MTQVKDDYMVGLDIGTNSCGWVATDFQNNILRLHGKNAIGSHLFEEGHSAADRRMFRTTRRRIKRRRWRLNLLEEIFDPYIANVDPYFFARLKASGLSPKDSSKKYESIVFPTIEEDKSFYQKYPTVYHLRKAFMNENKKFDLREIFIAIHQIIKYRGNFLQDTPISDFNASSIDVKNVLDILNEQYASLMPEYQISFSIENAKEIEKIIRDQTIFKQDKQKKISKLLPIVTKNKANSKISKDVAKQIANAILGYKTKFETLLLNEIDKNDKANWEFKLGDADADNKLELLLSSLNEAQQNIILEIKELFSAITLSEIVDEGKTLSESMVRKYEDHKHDLKLLKRVINNLSDRQKGKRLSLAYDLYVNNRHGKLLDAKKTLGKKGCLSKEDFYAEVEKNLDDSKESGLILNKINLDSFMPKQRTNENGVIPFQLHQIELDKIISNQGKYYPFLKEINPVASHRNQAPYKLDELVRFRVPYYVGPMIAPEKTKDKQKQANQSFAWMVRKEPGKITPWNFDQKVDRMASANKFIKRMTTKDTYLLGEDVLPANSLLYQKFTVLNELNNIRINGKKIPVDCKQQIFDKLFKNNSLVTTKKLITFLKENYKLVSVDIRGLADDKKFNSGLTTYNRLKHTQLFNQQIDNPKFRADLEQIIEWSTIFEDKRIYKAKLETVDWLNEKQMNILTNIRFQGWGRLSKKLLVNLHDSNGQNILEKLWDSQDNFMQIINEADFKEVITEANQSQMQSSTMEDILADAYTSPANKKAIRQVMKVVNDIKKAASSKDPKQIAIEFAREPEANPQITHVRGSRLQEIYKSLSENIVSKSIKNELDRAVKNKRLAKDKFFLYFMQLGRDAYTGKPINIDEIENGYQLDHILPQSFIKDDSLDNRVLVSSPVNNGKSDNVPIEMFGNRQAANLGMTIRQMWDNWKDLGVISKRKWNNLLLDPKHINKYQSSGFIHRQLVETSQIIKLVSTILQAEYPNTEIIVVKASSNHYLRKQLNLYKSREVNDYHHAIDAYLTAICGNLLYQVYPNLRPFFVYGKYKRFSTNPDEENEIFKHVRRFDFIARLFGKNSLNNITAGKNGPIVFKRDTIINQLHHAYEYKYMIVSTETTTRDQEMFNMTIYPRAERDIKKTRSLIPKGKGLSVAIYGGYSGNSDAYMALVKVNKAKESEYRIIGVPMRALSLLRSSNNSKETLHQILEPKVFLNKKGKRKTAVKSFEILRERVPYKQVIVDGDKKFMVGSSTYVYNAKQLTLSNNAVKTITENINDDNNATKNLDHTYDEILGVLDKYLSLFDINKFREKLHNGRNKFMALSDMEKQNTLREILKGLHDNPVTGNLKNIGLSTPLGQMQIKSGILLSPEAKLIYQSPTGLFEKRVKISNL